MSEGLTKIRKEDIPGRTFLQLVNYDNNVEMLKEVPHRLLPFPDIAVIIKINFGDFPDGSKCVATAKDDLLEFLGVSFDLLYDIAYTNTIRNMDVCARLLDEILYSVNNVFLPFDMDSSTPIYVVGSKDMYNGGVLMLYPEYISGLPAGEYYVIPSSIHELMFVPAEDIENPAFLRDIVEEVNKTLDPSDVLSNHIYSLSFHSQEFHLVL